MSTETGGRIFSAASRSLIEEDEIELTSVGVDIGSSTSHLLFSKITLERSDTRYIIAAREVLYESEILLTPYRDDTTIDAEALAAFVEAQYRGAGLAREEIDTGALILTGVAVRRANARAIGDVFSAEAGKFVSVSAGDALETLMAAHGSGAAAFSRDGMPVLNIDVGGGTTKLALCIDGEPVAMTAVEAGARLIAFAEDGTITRLEPFGRRALADAGFALELGDKANPEVRRALAARMADDVIAAAGGADLGDKLRLPPLNADRRAAFVQFSGGVSEFVYTRTAASFGDLGPDLAAALIARATAEGYVIADSRQGIRATVVGASQYTVQVSGSTIYFDPPDALPLRNLPVIAPTLDLGETVDAAAVAAAVGEALARMDVAHGDRAVAVAVPWRGSATFHRLRALTRGLIDGLAAPLAAGHPLVIVLDGDVGGLIGIHARVEEGFPGTIVSIDGIRLSEFDFIDIGEVLKATGAAPVVVKSLVFPTQ